MNDTKKPHSWVKRTARAFRVGNGVRRGLFWREGTYKEWYEYAKLSPIGYPEEFGDLSQLSFDEWWKHDIYGFNLFCEPVVAKPLLVVKDITDEQDYKYLKIDLNGSPEALRHMFNKFLDKNLNKQTDILSRARFQPSKKQGHIKLSKLKQYRETYIKRVIENKSRKQVLEERGETFITDDKLRAVSREVQKVRLIFKNIKKGSFP